MDTSIRVYTRACEFGEMGIFLGDSLISPLCCIYTTVGNQNWSGQNGISEAIRMRDALMMVTFVIYRVWLRVSRLWKIIDTRFADSHSRNYIFIILYFFDDQFI